MNKKQIAFVGSFNYMHDGHIYVLKQAINDFDLIYVIISNNPNKHHHPMWCRKIKAQRLIKKSCLDTKKIKILKNKGMTVDILKKYNINCILRGYRNKDDYQYEQMLYTAYLKHMPKLKRILIKSDEAHKNLRSSNLKH